MTEHTPFTPRPPTGPSARGRAVVEPVPGIPGRSWMVLSGEFDIDSRDTLQDALRAAVVAAEQAGPELLRVDVTRVTFADSSFLNSLLVMRERIVLAGPLPGQLSHLLTLTGTAPLFTYTTGGDSVTDRGGRVREGARV
ncbi:STAS domain-containing protein [Streptomyces sp. NPDC097619]|uniref:STAS domain-containing protein n=1 Tax=Streptomyces sp. NPDC097619 TaxID=3157228 RepID=UPI00331ADD90